MNNNQAVKPSRHEILRNNYVVLYRQVFFFSLSHSPAIVANFISYTNHIQLKKNTASLHLSGKIFRSARILIHRICFQQV